MISWALVGKAGLRVAKAAAVMAIAGYLKYRMDGGEPIHKVYKKVKAENARQAVYANAKGNEILMERLKKAKNCSVNG